MDYNIDFINTYHWLCTILVIGVYILVSPIGSLLKLYYDGAFCILLLDQARTSANRFLAIASNDNNLVNSPNDDLNPVHVHSLIMLSIDYVTWSSSETNAFFVIILLIILVFSMRRLVPDHSYQQCPAGVLAATTIPFTLHLVGISDSEFYRLKTVFAELVMISIVARYTATDVLDLTSRLLNQMREWRRVDPVFIWCSSRSSLAASFIVHYAISYLLAPTHSDRVCVGSAWTSCCHMSAYHQVMSSPLGFLGFVAMTNCATGIVGTFLLTFVCGNWSSTITRMMSIHSEDEEEEDRLVHELMASGSVTEERVNSSIGLINGRPAANVNEYDDSGYEDSGRDSEQENGRAGDSGIDSGYEETISEPIYLVIGLNEKTSVPSVTEDKRENELGIGGAVTIFMHGLDYCVKQQVVSERIHSISGVVMATSVAHLVFIKSEAMVLFIHPQRLWIQLRGFFVFVLIFITTPLIVYEFQDLQGDPLVTSINVAASLRISLKAIGTVLELIVHVIEKKRPWSSIQLVTFNVQRITLVLQWMLVVYIVHGAYWAIESDSEVQSATSRSTSQICCRAVLHVFMAVFQPYAEIRLSRQHHAKATAQLQSLAPRGRRYAISSSCCSVCFERLTSRSDNNETVLTECRHAFHRTCLYEWLRIRPTCPSCYQPLFV